MLNGSAARMISWVISMSACDGFGSPLGWLCIKMIAVAPSSRERFMISRG